MMFKVGELVYLLDDKEKRFWLSLEPNMLKVQGLGVIDGKRLIGLEDGSKVTIAGRDFMLYSVAVSEMMESLERGPQIITPKDASTMVFRLGLRSGSTVLEAGVGSGALTIALLNYVTPTGKVISVEVREDFANRARRNIVRTGLESSSIIRIEGRETYDVGTMVDAVALDMPDPALALSNVGRFLKNGGRLCAFVPNTNQVEETVNAMRNAGYDEVRTVENIQRIEWASIQEAFAPHTRT